MKIIPLILSGGSGSRLWPLSNSEMPKQFLPLISNKTMIQETLLRLDGLETGTPIVLCGEKHRFFVAQQILEVSDKKPEIILEPVAKNTAPAIAAGCCAALKQDSNAIVIVLPSDHVIADVKAFQTAVKLAAEVAMDNKLVTFGIRPTFPSTGYGYIKVGEKNSSEQGYVFDLDSFVEKPCLEKAEQYLFSGNYFWNSGIFVFKASAFLSELKKFNPDMADLSVKSYEKATLDNDFVRLDKSYFGKIVGDSIDYVVMEKTSNGKVIKLNAGWDDVGSWSALYDMSKKDINMNVLKGNVIALDTTSSYIRGNKRIIATIGLDNVVVVDSDEGILIAAKGKIQEVKKIVETLNSQKK